MNDRVPGAPGQYQLTITPEEFQKLQSGQTGVVTLKRDDKPITEGTPYSKAAVLPDELAQKICPEVTDPTPAEAIGSLLALNGSTPMSGDLEMAGHSITNVKDPVKDGDAVNLRFYKENKHISGKKLYTGQLNPGSSANVPGISKYTCILVRLGRAGESVYGTPIACYAYNGVDFRGSSGSCYTTGDSTELFFVNAQIEKGDTLKLNAAKLYFMNNTTPPALTDWWNMYIAEIIGVF